MRAFLTLLCSTCCVLAVSCGAAGQSLSLNHPSGAYRAGDALRVSYGVDSPAYVYVFYHQADQQAVLLFPNHDARDNHLTPRQELTTPAQGDSLQCRIAAPFGREVVQVVASPAPIAAFEEARQQAGDGVATIATKLVDQVCQRQLKTHGLTAQHVVVTTSAR